MMRKRRTLLLMEGIHMNNIVRKTGIAAGVLALAVTAGCGGKSTGAGMIIAQAETVKAETKYKDAEAYQMSDEYYAYLDEHYKSVEASRTLQDQAYPFYQKTMQAFLKKAGNENRVYSPLNVYIALGMLAECADGNSRKQLLDLLGAENTEDLRNIIDAAWTANSADNPVLKELYANSIWLNENIAFHQEIPDLLAKQYHASSYKGKMGTDELNKAFQDWLNDNTGHLLEEYAKNQKTEADTVMALASALYLKASWASAFEKELTKEETFHAPDKDIQTEMMHSSETGTVYYGNGWKAVSLYLTDCGVMWFILPEEGLSPEILLDDPEVYELIKGNYDGIESRTGTVNLSLPKLDVSSEISLIDELKKLGVTDIFTGSADFSPLTDTEAYISSISHAARLKSDEDGVEAAAFTVVMMTESALAGEPEIIDFTADHPFLFALSGQDHAVLFTGIVNHPAD